MKKISIILVLFISACRMYSQNSNDDLPAEFKEVAVAAFEKVTPATKQWFVETAKQHPAGKFDTSWTRKKLIEKFGKENVDVCGGIFAVMMAYQKMMNKEAREDKKISRMERDVELSAKSEKIKMENQKIDQMKQEAQEKADQQMQAAQAEMWIGIVSVSASAFSGNSQLQTGRVNTGNKQIVNGTNVRVVDSPKLKPVNATDKIRMTEKQKEKSDAADKTSDDHRKAIKDAVKKLLDQMAEISNSVKL